MLLLIVGGIGLTIAKKINITIPMDFVQVGQGKMLLRDKNDRVYSAVIMSYEGFKKFKSQYSIQFEASKKNFEHSFYIVGFSDKSWVIEADGFKRLTYAHSYYYLDIADTGVEIKASPPPEGRFSHEN